MTKHVSDMFKILSGLQLSRPDHTSSSQIVRAGLQAATASLQHTPITLLVAIM
jgi:hypothetical protein